MRKVLGNKYTSALLFAVLVTSVFADLSVSDVTVLPETVRPGSSGIVKMTVTNPDSSDAYAVRVEGTGTGQISTVMVQSFGDFKTGISTIASLPFSVSKDTPAGVHTLTYRYSWTNKTSTRYKHIMVPVTVTNPAVFSVEADAGSIYNSGDFEVPVKISNSGGAARDVRVTLNSSRFLQTGSNPLPLGDLGRKQNTEFNLGVALAPNVESGVYSVPLTITYQDEGGQELKSNSYLRLSVKRKAPSFSITQTEDAHLNPGKKVNLKIMIENTGDESAYETRVRLADISDLSSITATTGSTSSQDLQVITMIGSNDIYAGSLEPGQSKEIMFDVGVSNTVPGFYRPFFVVEYRDINGDLISSELVPVGIQVEASTDVEVFVSSKPAPIYSGAEHTFSVLVSNVGSSDIKAMTVEVESDSFILQEAQPTQFIGGIDEDDFSTVQYKVKVKPGLKEGLHPLDVKLNFKDTYNNEKSVKKTVQLNVKQMVVDESAPLVGTVIGIVVLIVLALMVWFLFFRKKKDHKKH